MRKIEEDVESPAAGGGVPPATLPEAPPVLQVSGHPGLGTCDCGSDTFILVNEFNRAEMPGIRSSRMYECTRCGKYRLGK